jgi:hypothetical protein
MKIFKKTRAAPVKIPAVEATSKATPKTAARLSAAPIEPKKDMRPLGESQPRGVSTAIFEAKKLLRGDATDKKGDQGSTVVLDSENANSADDVNQNSKRFQDATGLVKANTLLETEALKKLSAAEQNQYKTVRAQLNADPVAQLALQTMLLEGKLPGAKELGGDKKDTTLSNLNVLATQELAPGIDRAQLVADVTQELAVPEGISQGYKGTCAPTTLEIQLAQNNPAEYVRLITGLSSKEGTIVTVRGDTLKREDDWNHASGTDRTLSQQLLAPALMELANGTDNYDNSEDENQRNYRLFSIGDGSGLSVEQVDRALESLYGKDFTFSNVNSDKDRKGAMDLLQAETKAGRSVTVALDWGKGSHKVLVTGFEMRGGVEHVRYINPWGQVEVLPRKEFETRLKNLNYDPNAS